MSQQLYKAISLAELFALVFLTLYGVSRRNSYAAFLVAILLGKQIPEKVIKHLGKKAFDVCGLKKHGQKFSYDCPSAASEYRLELSRRPADANDCNMINSGSNASLNPGMPSGHTTVVSFLFFTVLLNWMHMYQKDRASAPTFLFIIVSILQALVPLARVKLHCHTTQQVLGGFILGLTLAIVFAIIEHYALIRMPRYVADKENFYRSFVW